jgi:hypothetical protein
MITGLIFTFVTLLVISSHTLSEDVSPKVDAGINAPILELQTFKDTNKVKEDEKKMERGEALEHKAFPITKATILFQALLILSSIYYAMLLTNWGSPA